MAVCEIWDVRGRLDHPIDYAMNEEKTVNPKYTEAELQSLGDVMGYATNSAKTEKQFYVSGVNCEPSTARQEMVITKRQFMDESPIVCYHGFQSFKEGEVTPQQAHEIGVRLAEKMWGDRFQVVVATHLNTDHLHNHFVLNSVSFADGKHYYDNKENLRKMRSISDELCREYQLSVIENPKGSKKPYALHKAEKMGLPTRDQIARSAIDEAISRSFTVRDFEKNLMEMGYWCKFNPNYKYWTIQGSGWKRPKRLYRLGEEYTKERILERISENSYRVRFQTVQKPKRKIIVKKKLSHQSFRKRSGLRGLYLHYCKLLKGARKRQDYARIHYLLKDDLLKLEIISQETRLLCKHTIDRMDELRLHKASIEREYEQLSAMRKKLYRKTEGKEQLAKITERIKEIRKEIRLCEGIEMRSKVLGENIRKMREEEKNEQFRRSRTGRENEFGRWRSSSQSDRGSG